MHPTTLQPTSKAPSRSPTQCSFTQIGSKLVGNGTVGATSLQGFAVSISSDGNTAVVGGYADNTQQGAAWIFTRNSSNLWSQQGLKLVGTGNAGAAVQGFSVAISGNGNTVIIGGSLDNSFQGAAWIFVRSGSRWSQQGSKLKGTGNAGAAQQGVSVSISHDGNTAVVGGDRDSSNRGAAWIFVRSGSTWSQQGSKLVGTGNVGASQQGASVSISGFGNTTIVGGFADDSNQGAAWVFVRSGVTWSQQGLKLKGTGNSGSAVQGVSVSISGDGNTAIVGGFFDDGGRGAAWVFARSGATWSQQGSKLVGNGNSGMSVQGASVSISANGNTAILGGWMDNSDQGAAWLFVRSGSTWSQKTLKIVGTGNVGAAQQGRSVSTSADGSMTIVGGSNDFSNRGAAWIFNTSVC